MEAETRHGHEEDHRWQGIDHGGVLCRIDTAELVREWKYVRGGETPAERRRRVLGQS
ncbi:hypothetical protein ACFW6F_26660 [Streptomyces sp. NPDC058746]|uniref:hypothetical protein n=1 Tax=Streptomyces sp. NPDC058746 TaxID=3346622 RepID=UPI00367FF22F